MTPIVQWLAAAAEQAAARPRSEAQLVLPEFNQVHMLGTTGTMILALGQPEALRMMAEIAL